MKVVKIACPQQGEGVNDHPLMMLSERGFGSTSEYDVSVLSFVENQDAVTSRRRVLFMFEWMGMG